MRQLLFKHSIGAYICIEWPRLAVGHQRNNSSIEWHTNDRCRRSLGWKNRSNFRFINYNYSIWISKQTHIIWVRILSHFAREYVSTLQWKYNWNGNGWIMHDVIAYLNLSTLTSLYSAPNHRITMVCMVYLFPQHFTHVYNALVSWAQLLHDFIHIYVYATRTYQIRYFFRFSILIPIKMYVLINIYQTIRLSSSHTHISARCNYTLTSLMRRHWHNLITFSTIFHVGLPPSPFI